MMAYVRVISALAILVFAALPAWATPDQPISVERLTGSWDVSLYYSPDAPPSSTEMVIDGTGQDGQLSGSFYGSGFAPDSRATERDGATAFIAVTRDGTGEYIHSGRLGADDMIEGQTLSRGRGFLMTWTARRTAEKPE
ncbi:MAG TPA: hypothetical protein EYG02_01360 [Henriciella marina]|uniref:hypothetical protein n=1 Tax=Henriciella sp. TaxID=1968823 RepID=UPI001820C331|nr:hypothetical protein [Henriciella sp.]HIG24104.1 hypothetical protein [Henriciella sp.]HIK63661.1 hypothetical protein [Henriciella marina]